MRFAILSRQEQSYSTQSIKQAARRRGHRISVLDIDQFLFCLSSDRPEFLFKGRKLPRFDYVIPRLGPLSAKLCAAVVRHFEQMGVRSLNSAQGILVSCDKLWSLQELGGEGVPIPDTVLLSSVAELDLGSRKLGGFPLVIKLREGTHGAGVALAENRATGRAVFKSFEGAWAKPLIQRFVGEVGRGDIRALVVGNRVVAAMRRRAKPGEFRCNVHRGGSIEPVLLNKTLSRLAIKAVRVLGLAVAGVDMIEVGSQAVVLEVNCSPGLEAIERASGIDVAGEIVKFIEANCDARRTAIR